MADYVAVITFPDNSLTYEAFAKITNSPGSAGLESAVVIERDEQGTLRIVQGGDSRAGIGMFSGTFIGMFVGILAGPLGMLLGSTLGLAGGALYDANRLDDGDDIITQFGRLVPPGRNAILASTKEAETGMLDSYVTSLGGVIGRRPMDEVMAEMEAQQQAAEDAAKAARQAMKDEKSKQKSEDREQRLESLRSRQGSQDGADQGSSAKHRDSDSSS